MIWTGDFQPSEREEKLDFLRSNPNAEFWLRVTDRARPTTVIAALMQVLKDRDDDLLCVGFHLLRVRRRAPRQNSGQNVQALASNAPANANATLAALKSSDPSVYLCSAELEESEVVQVFRTAFQPTWEVSKKFVLPPDDSPADGSGCGTLYVLVPATAPLGSKGQYTLGLFSDAPLDAGELPATNLKVRRSAKNARVLKQGLKPARLDQQLKLRNQQIALIASARSGGGGVGLGIDEEDEDDDDEDGADESDESDDVSPTAVARGDKACNGVQVLDGAEVSVVRGGRVVHRLVTPPNRLRGGPPRGALAPLVQSDSLDALDVQSVMKERDDNEKAANASARGSSAMDELLDYDASKHAANSPSFGRVAGFAAAVVAVGVVAAFWWQQRQRRRKLLL